MTRRLIHFLRRTEFVGSHDTNCVTRPGNGNFVLSKPFTSRKGTDDHQQGTDEFLDVGRPVLFVFDASRRDAQDQAGWENGGSVLERGLENGDEWLDHGALQTVFYQL